MDGLLGIGAAGGSSSKSEADKLQARLDTLRKERAERAPEIKKKEAVAVGAAASSSSGQIYNDNGGATRKNKPNRKKKKKKRGKR